MATLAELMLKARQRADSVDRAIPTDTQLTGYLNDSIEGLRDIVKSVDQEHYTTASGIQTVANTSSYALPVDFLEGRRVDYTSGGQTYTLRPYGFQEGNKYSGYTRTGRRFSGEYFQYKYVGDNINLIPDPSVSGDTITINYIPLHQELVDNADTAALLGQQETWVVLDAAIKILNDEESDPMALMVEQARVEKRIELSAQRRDSGMPEGAYDVSELNDWQFDDFGVY